MCLEASCTALAYSKACAGNACADEKLGETCEDMKCCHAKGEAANEDVCVEAIRMPLTLETDIWGWPL